MNIRDNLTEREMPTCYVTNFGNVKLAFLYEIEDLRKEIQNLRIEIEEMKNEAEYEIIVKEEEDR